MLRRLTSSAPQTGQKPSRQVVDGELAGERVEVGAHRSIASGSASLIASPARCEQVQPRRAEARIPVLGRDAREPDRARHAARLRHRLLEPVEDRVEVRRPRACGRGAARRGLSRPLSRAWRTTPQACSMSWSSSRGALDPVVDVLGRAAAPQRAGDVAQQRADPVVDGVDLVRGAAVAQRRPDEEVHEQADRDADAGVEQPRTSMPPSSL